MWPSIKNVDIPKTFSQAIEFQSKSKGTLFGGGTYLVSEKSSKINNLVDINWIVDKSIEIKDNSIIIGAGSSIQNIIDSLNEHKSLTESAKYSCSSKNIRNQRTIGVEIAQKRVQSELFTYLVAINPILEIRTPEKENVHLREWDGQGIINKIIINKIDLKSSGFERFATLQSAPAFVIVAVVRRALELDFVISGKTTKVYGQTIKLADFSKNALKSIISQSVLFFENDQYGSLEYKKSLIETGIQRAVEKI
ncbi:MAG: FAD binding domain-containing protein [Candidatus Marinimicrobia bacterium]|nr:FAD binding domain-containing protein [Candidatus Neomarinimicrobiota bacterium]